MLVLMVPKSTTITVTEDLNSNNSFRVTTKLAFYCTTMKAKIVFSHTVGRSINVFSYKFTIKFLSIWQAGLNILNSFRNL